MPCGRRILLLICFATLPVFAQKAPTLEYYLPPETTFDPEIPTPAQVFGWEPGTWHLRHDQLVRYFEVLAEKSDRVTLKVTGHTHEQRPLQLATITSPKNHINIDRIRRRHMKLVEEPEAEHDFGSMPVITWLGYGVHGNESRRIQCRAHRGLHSGRGSGEDRG